MSSLSLTIEFATIASCLRSGSHAAKPRDQWVAPCASDLLESGVSLPAVQRLLGHASVQTTSRYLQIADPERARAMKKHPLNDYLGQSEAKRATTTTSAAACASQASATTTIERKAA